MCGAPLLTRMDCGGSALGVLCGKTPVVLGLYVISEELVSDEVPPLLASS